MTVRAHLVANLDAMDAAGTALRWARHLLPVRHVEPRAWETLVHLLDRLDEPAAPGLVAPAGVRGLLAMAGLHLLSSVGYALELQRCVVCGRACPEGAPAFVDGPRGGLVCRACGGGGVARLLEGRLRQLAARAQLGEGEDPAEGEAAAPWLTVPQWVTPAQAEDLLALLADAMAAHAGLDASK